jgi:uncharacterized membrane protein YcaP (DUF421 family)
MEIINTIFGEGQDLTILQMSGRAFIMFFITLALIRISGMRSFGFKTAFDSIIVIMLGAVLSRAVTGASPAIPTIAAGLVLCLTHRLFAFISVKNEKISHFMKGKELSLYKNGKMNDRNMQRCNISKGDLMEGVRINANTDTLAEVNEIFMERNGKISVVK